MGGRKFKWWMNDNDLVQGTETTWMGDGRGLKSFSFKCKSHFEIQIIQMSEVL